MLGGGNPLTVGVGIIIEVIRKNNSDYDPDVGADANAQPSSRDPIYLGALLRLFAEHVPDFMSLVLNAPAQKQRLDSTSGVKIEPLGFDRFKTCELMAELLHCSNMALLNEVGAEQVILRRDEERSRLRLNGHLTATRGEETHSSEDLTMRTRHSSPDDSRRLGVTNASDDDGFEEVTSSGEMTEDTSHEFVKAEDEIPITASSSFLDRDDDDFVDEPLTSPRLNVEEGNLEDHHFEIPELVVAPLSPKKSTKPVLVSSAAEGEPSTPSGKSAPTQATVEASASNEATHMVIEVSSDAQASIPEVTPEEPTSSSSKVTSSAEDGMAVELTQGNLESVSKKSGTETLLSTQTPSVLQDIGAPYPPGTDRHPVNDQLPESAPGVTVAEQPEPVVGDFLKIQFVRNNVVPTILVFSLFYAIQNPNYYLTLCLVLFLPISLEQLPP